MLNFTSLNNKSIRIMFSHRDPTIRKSGAANIFIKVFVLSCFASLVLSDLTDWKLVPL